MALFTVLMTLAPGSVPQANEVTVLGRLHLHIRLSKTLLRHLWAPEAPQDLKLRIQRDMGAGERLCPEAEESGKKV